MTSTSTNCLRRSARNAAISVYGIRPLPLSSLP
jgi:F420-0:gamma-glutamyl ligase